MIKPDKKSEKMNLNTLITKKETLVSNSFNESIHIALCFDKNYGLPAGVLLTSILDNNQDKNLNIHLFVLSINDDDIEKFKQFKSANIHITLYYVNDNFKINPDTLVLPYITSIATCLRLFIPEYLNDVTERLLYFDCDMICNGNLAEIIKHPISDKIAAVVLDMESTQQKRSESCHLEVGTYFNAGMLYINTCLWTKLNITAKALTKINDGKIYEYADQDILNILLSGEVIYLSSACNRLQFKHDKLGFIEDKILNNTVIFHYYGANKPWFVVNMDKLYQHYLSRSFWKEAKLAMANSKAVSTLRLYSRYYHQQGDFVTSIKYKIRYFLAKLHLISDIEKYL